jgi:hypothetical protein
MTTSERQSRPLIYRTRNRSADLEGRSKRETCIRQSTSIQTVPDDALAIMLRFTKPLAPQGTGLGVPDGFGMGVGAAIAVVTPIGVFVTEFPSVTVMVTLSLMPAVLGAV